jgi:hypothetical protein
LRSRGFFSCREIVEQQSVDLLALEVIDRGPQRRLVVVRDVDVRQDADLADDPEVKRQPRLGLRWRHCHLRAGGPRLAVQLLAGGFLPPGGPAQSESESHPSPGLL